MLFDYSRHPFFPRSKEECLFTMLDIMSLSKNLEKKMLPLVLCSPYQNAIRIVYVIIGRCRDIMMLMVKQITEPEFENDIDEIAKLLINNTLSLSEILEVMNYLVHKNFGNNITLKIFIKYLHKLDMVTCYVISCMLKADVEEYCNDYEPRLYIVKRLRCFICHNYVTFLGCMCTLWNIETSIDGETRTRLLDPSHDGPPSKKLLANDEWYNTYLAMKFEYAEVNSYVHFFVQFNYKSTGEPLLTLKENRDDEPSGSSPRSKSENRKRGEANNELVKVLNRRLKYIKFSSILSNYNQMLRILVKHQFGDTNNEEIDHDVQLTISTSDAIFNVLVKRATEKE